ncbi:MAG: type II secretion system GspH family protein [Campylobacter sp.]|uniref:type II secretion system protein n=1 Tax=Campylobacter sp. TaxID=205 RepID=UPI002A75EA7F|nr:type II secretion system protein [Campylobacter sp.]MCI6178359.1 type II secretion system GspH family protein [Campylobacter sp.]MDY3245550.1 type II secretion system protein [Campylobacter sp.]
MKKGFTMIELIFVIVILGILASVAIPRLAATREDAEISAAVANLRTLVNDATAYYTVKGTFDNVKWSAITNVPIKKDDSGGAIGDTTATTDAYLKVGDAKDCIKVKLVNKNGTTPAHIKFTKKGSPTGTCDQVLKSDPLKPYIDSEVTKTDGTKESNAIVVGSSTSVYPPSK